MLIPTVDLDDWAEEADPPDSEDVDDFVLEGGSTDIAGTWSEGNK